MPAANGSNGKPSPIERARRQLPSRPVQAQIERLQKAICEPARLQIFQALSAGPLSVEEIAAVIGRAPAATSQHLRVLRDLGIVERARRGTRVYYRLAQTPAAQRAREAAEALERAGGAA